MQPPVHQSDQEQKIAELQEKLREAQDVIQAVTAGTVDALVIGETIHALNGAETYYRLLIESMNEGAMALSHEGVILFANQKMCELLRREPDAVIGRKLNEFASKHHVQHVESLLNAGCSGESRGEFDVIRPSGEIIPLQISTGRIKSGESPLLCAVCIDLTRRKSEQKALEKSARNQNLICQAILDLNSCRDFSQAVSCLLAQAMGLTSLECGAVFLQEGDLTHRCFSEGPWAPHSLPSCRKTPQALTRMLRDRPGGRLHSPAILKDLFDPEMPPHPAPRLCLSFRVNPEVTGLVVLASSNPPDDQDQPGERELLEILAAGAELVFARLSTSETLQVVLSSLVEGVVVIAEDNRIVEANQCAREMLGVEPGSPLASLLPPSRWTCLNEDGEETSFPEHPASRWRDPDWQAVSLLFKSTSTGESQKWIQLGMRRVSASNVRKSMLLVLSFVDMTERQALDAQLRQSQKMEALGQLTGGMAHEFNNILAAMMLSLDLTKSMAGDQSTRDGISEVEGFVCRARDIIRQLLAFSRKATFQPQPIELREFVRTECRMLARLLGENIQLSISLPPEALWVRIDRGAMAQVLLNLCLNARDAMPRGGTLRICVPRPAPTAAASLSEPAAETSRYIRCLVSDTGIGMHESVLRHLFEPFFTTKPVGTGTGLGLATIKGILEQHGGKIEVRSEPGRGSTFEILLPELQKAECQPACETSVPRTIHGRGRILLVEDEDALRSLESRFLGRIGFEIVEARDGLEAMEIWKRERNRIDLVLTDMVMPNGVSGLELARRLKTEAPALKVVITSGHSRESIPPEFAEDATLAFAPKPCIPSELCQIVQNLLAKT